MRQEKGTKLKSYNRHLSPERRDVPDRRQGIDPKTGNRSSRKDIREKWIHR